MSPISFHDFKEWSGASVAVLASGPSMSQEIASLIRSYRPRLKAIVVNTTYQLYKDADILVAADHAWWGVHQGAPDFLGVKVTVDLQGAVDCNMSKFPDVRYLTVTGASGFDPTPGCVRTGSNSAYQALHLAMSLGASKVLLFGLDLHGTHWHEDHPEPLRNLSDRPYFEKLAARFATIVPYCESLGVTVKNCTPGSSLHCFASSELHKEMR